MSNSSESGKKSPEVKETESRRPYQKPKAQPQGQIKPSLLGSPPPVP